MDSACPAVSFSDATISFRPLNVPSSVRICVSAPSDTSSVIRAIVAAAAASCSVCAVTRRASNFG